MFGNKKGIYYTLDALLSGFLLIGVVLIVLNADFGSNTLDQEVFIARDIISALDQLKVHEFSDLTFISDEINNGNITDVDKSLLELIGYYWATNQSEKSEVVFNILADNVLKDQLGARLVIGDDVLYSRETGSQDNVFVASRMLSGIDEAVPLEGASSSAYLKRIRNKKSSSYAYLGGFVGQGNVTFTGEPVPLDINESKIEDVYLEGDFASDFNFFINGTFCDALTVNKEPLNVDSYYLDDCKSLIGPGVNEFKIEFLEDFSEAYVAGGLLRIDYRTDELQQIKNFSRQTYNFPEIIGLANLYDSFYIPGILEEINVHLIYETNESAYITIGERIIGLNNASGHLFSGVEGSTENIGGMLRFNVSLSDSFFRNNVNLDYDLVSNNTVPLRFASYEVVKEVVQSGDADVILISDHSQSMMRALEDWSMGDSSRMKKCEEALAHSDTRRSHLAACLSYDFADTILNYTGNRLWPVYMHDDEIKYYHNPEDLEAIKGFMGSFPQGEGHSCISCAVNQAYEILNEYTNESRKTFVVLMTDGVPTDCSQGDCSSTSVDYGSRQCPGICNQAGNCPPSTREDQCNQCIDNPEAVNNLLFSVERLVQEFNSTIFTIGFGPVEECDFAGDVLNQVAIIGNGTYQHSSNVEDIQLIYENISFEILSRIEQKEQIVDVREGEVNSNLLKGSHIDFVFQPLISEPSPGKISVTFEEPLQSCDNTFDIPLGLEIIDAKVTSYSASNWSDLVISNDITVFNLSDYYVPYPRLGDPFEIQVPVTTLNEGENNIVLGTGSSPENRSGCSADNKFIYTALVPSVTARTDVKPENIGCSWEVEFEYGDNQTINVPQDYEGDNTCSYTSSEISFNINDTYDVAMFDLLSRLDTNSNGRVLININELDLEVTTTILQNIPYLWGPVILRLEVWT